MAMVNRTYALVVLVAVLVIGLAVVAALQAPPPAGSAAAPASLREEFGTGALDTDAWIPTQDGDLRARETDVVDSAGGGDFRLRLGVDTLGTGDETVKFLGVRSARPVRIGNGTEVSFDLDWNNQSNGCYLSASFYLCPTATESNPEGERDWLKFEYVGVPPGRNARAVVASSVDGRIETLFADGWPDRREGRPIGDQRVRIALGDGAITVLENEREVYRSDGPVVDLSFAFVYLQMSSHSNYPLREVFFDNVVVRTG